MLNTLAADQVVYFAGALHPECQSRPAYGWVCNGDKAALKRTTNQWIPAMVGISRGAMLHHYATKQALIVSVIEYTAYKH